MFVRLVGALVGLAMIGMAGSANATPIVVAGQLVGATNIDVGGTLYNVDFADGTCIGLFKNAS